MMYKKEAWAPSLLFLMECYTYAPFCNVYNFTRFIRLFRKHFSAPEGPGSIITGRAEQGVSLKDLAGLGNNQNSGVGLPINALLWRASLDIMSIIPLDDVDTFGGTIVTEWYQLNEKSDERIKIAAFVLDRELRADGIRVVVYLQKRFGDVWKDSGKDNGMSKQLEELILTRAREIRATGIVQSTNWKFFLSQMNL